MTSTPKTFDAFVPRNFLELFDLAKIRPDYISFDALRAVPLDDAHVAATTYAEKHLPNSAFAHSLRTYYFALAILHNGFPSETPGTPQITFEELQKRLYYACVMHDLGWTTHPGPDGVDHPAHAMSFELFGGIMAYDCLHAIVQSSCSTPQSTPPVNPRLSGLSWYLGHRSLSWDTQA
ncbi:hypothetical protein K438DRAFT_1983661 [Mycena galopus ATCC 62051]|nr:hypothetical protein K438DRAFT_1983661 [Mycena galopus ATCC 62051]